MPLLRETGVEAAQSPKDYQPWGSSRGVGGPPGGDSAWALDKAARWGAACERQLAAARGRDTAKGGEAAGAPVEPPGEIPQALWVVSLGGTGGGGCQVLNVLLVGKDFHRYP